MKKNLIAVLLSVVLAGCSTPAPVQVDVSYASKTGMIRRAVVVGLTHVDKASYNGWDGDCPGCDVDAETFHLLCTEQGVDSRLFLTEQATKRNLLAACRQAWHGMTAGDLFVFYISGHGGQVQDASGDEADGQDETLCLYDGELSDDVLGALWGEIPAGVLVFFVTDTCNSGTNYRHRKSIRKTIPRTFAGKMIHFGGCADGLSSIGSEQGGYFTTALIDAWRDGISYNAWFVLARSKMPLLEQIPAYAEYGNVTDEFRNGQALK